MNPVHLHLDHARLGAAGRVAGVGDLGATGHVAYVDAEGKLGLLPIVEVQQTAPGNHRAGRIRPPDGRNAARQVRSTFVGKIVALVEARVSFV